MSIGFEKRTHFYYPQNYVSIFTLYCQGAWEVDQQRIISGIKQCSRHLNKKIGLPISFFLEQTKKNIDQIPKNITHFIFGNEAPKAALSNYSVQYLRL